MTAVEFLESKIFGDKIFSLSKEMEKAKEMEKQQIIEACENTIKSFELDKDKTGFFVMAGEGYYNQTYNK